MAKSLTVKFIGDTRDLSRAFSQIDKQSVSLRKSLGGFAKTAALGAGAAGIGALVVGLKGAVSAAKEAEKAQARLEQALASANISYDKHGAAINAAIQKTSKLAALDDEDLSDAFAKLVRTTGDVTKATEGMALAADIARARNISLEAATKMVEKAQAGQETAFTRVGIRLKKNQDATDALTIAQERFGGAAEKYGKTAAGSQERLSVAFENLQEKVGAKVIPIMTKLVEALLKVVTWAEQNWPKFQAVISQGVEAVRLVVDKLRPIFENIIGVIRGIVTVVSALIQGDWSRVWAGMKEIVSSAFGAVIAIIRLQLDAAVAVVRKLADAVVGALRSGLGLAKDVATSAMAAVVSAIGNAIGALLDGFAKILAAAGKVPIIGGKFRDAASSVQAMADRVRGLDDRIRGLNDKTVTVTTNFVERVTRSVSIIEERRGALPRAHGGPVWPDQPFLVGERGPELIVPRGSGDVVPNDRLAGFTINVDTVNVRDTSDIELFGELVNRRLKFARA